VGIDHQRGRPLARVVQQGTDLEGLVGVVLDGPLWRLGDPVGLDGEVLGVGEVRWVERAVLGRDQRLGVVGVEVVGE
jgi:hypothetical protein